MFSWKDMFPPSHLVWHPSCWRTKVSVFWDPCIKMRKPFVEIHFLDSWMFSMPRSSFYSSSVMWDVSSRLHGKICSLIKWPHLWNESKWWPKSSFFTNKKVLWLVFTLLLVWGHIWQCSGDPPHTVLLRLLLVVLTVLRCFGDQTEVYNMPSTLSSAFSLALKLALL